MVHTRAHTTVVHARGGVMQPPARHDTTRHDTTRRDTGKRTGEQKKKTGTGTAPPQKWMDGWMDGWMAHASAVRRHHGPNAAALRHQNKPGSLIELAQQGTATPTNVVAVPTTTARKQQLKPQPPPPPPLLLSLLRRNWQTPLETAAAAAGRRGCNSTNNARTLWTARGCAATRRPARRSTPCCRRGESGGRRTLAVGGRWGEQNTHTHIHEHTRTSIQQQQQRQHR